MKQKTAVDWLVEKFNQCEPMYSGIMSNEHKKYLDGLIEQAKAMEKEQICNAFDKGWKDEMRIGEEYYNENYNQ